MTSVFKATGMSSNVTRDRLKKMILREAIELRTKEGMGTTVGTCFDTDGGSMLESHSIRVMLGDLLKRNVRCLDAPEHLSLQPALELSS